MSFCGYRTYFSVSRSLVVSSDNTRYLEELVESKQIYNFDGDSTTGGEGKLVEESAKGFSIAKNLYRARAACASRDVGELFSK